MHVGDNVVQPDILYVSRDRLNVVTREEVHGVPDLVIEILSPGTADKDRGLKRRLYARHGVRELWLVDPEGETIEVTRPGKTGLETAGVYKKTETLTSPSFPPSGSTSGRYSDLGARMARPPFIATPSPDRPNR
ncbi:MAG: Uma2 family endonuclease [Chloroflexi bacterium]|nr:Uma2 family endonuclease [Chloroflexota bacterium]